MTLAQKLELFERRNSYGIKKYMVNNANGDPEDIYIADKNAVDGAECLILRLRYTAGNLIEKKDVIEGVWSSTYDI